MCSGAIDARAALGAGRRRAPRPGPGCAGSRRGSTPPAASRLAEPVEQHPDRDVVGDELAALHVAARLEPDRRAVADGGAEQVAGRDVRDTEPLGEDAAPASPCRRRGPRAARRPSSDPGAPRHRSAHLGRRSSDEAFVVPHHQLGLDLLHRLDDDGHHDSRLVPPRPIAPRSGNSERRRATARRRRSPGTARRRSVIRMTTRAR